MNEMNPTPPQVPPQFAPTAPPLPPSQRALGENPEERAPITNPITAAEAILRQPRRVMFQLRQPGAGKLMASLFIVAMLCAIVYGVVVGTFAGGQQLWIAPVKIAGGMLVSALICLPSLYIFTCLSGSQSRLAEIFGLVMGMLMLTTILLIGFAPVAWLFSQSTESVNWMGTLHLIFWFIAAIFGLRFLDATFGHSQARSRAGLNTWIVIFMLVVVQMTTALRPIVGKTETFFPQEKKFFLSYWGDCLKQATDAPSNADHSRARYACRFAASSIHRNVSSRRYGYVFRLGEAARITTDHVLCRGDCIRSRHIRCRDGVVVMSLAGVLCRNQIAVSHSAHHGWQRAIERDARALARPEHNIPPIIPGCADDVCHRVVDLGGT